MATMHIPQWVRRQPLAVIGLVLLAAFVLAGLLAPWIAPANPASIDLIHRLQGPSAAHWCGTDELGRDTLRLLWGARLSLAVSVRGRGFAGAGTGDWRTRRLPRAAGSTPRSRFLE
jgi:ABC-type dipeptide/oligopeptide/nickel transport system permease subunit